jgi:hypothetical protein
MVREGLMQSFWTDRDHSSRTSQAPPALTCFADEACAAVARLFAYVGTLALILILAFHAWDDLRLTLADASHPRAGWAMDGRSQSAFPDHQLDPLDKSETYLNGHLWGDKDTIRRIGGDNLIVQRAKIGCLLDRMTLVPSGNEPKLSQLLSDGQRGACRGSDWMSGPAYPQLRGTL